ncbi:hypothetical protein [Streptomyces sp. NBC_01618]|nr:hypothetical protein OH735_11220 [Streptomyces sp. NBC_01618]
MVADATPGTIDVPDVAMARQGVEEEQPRLRTVRTQSAGHP